MRWTLLPIVLTCVLVTACSTRSRRPVASDGPTVLEVDNRGNLDVTVFVIEPSGARTRLGSVIAHTTERLTIPARMMTMGIVPLRFQADPVGGSAQPVTQTINVQPGDTVVLVLPVGGSALVEATTPLRYRMRVAVPQSSSSRARNSKPVLGPSSGVNSKIRSMSTSTSSPFSFRSPGTNMPSPRWMR